MEPISRRRAAVAGALGAAMLAAAAPRAQAAIAAADVRPPGLAVERGAKLRVLRPAKIVDPDEAIFNANSRRFSDEAGVEVRTDYVNWPDMPVQVAVAANAGQGPDMIVGFGADPHLHADKIIELTDLADYLGAKHGGWHELAQTYGRRFGSRAWLGLPTGAPPAPWCTAPPGRRRPASTASPTTSTPSCGSAKA